MIRDNQDGRLRGRVGARAQIAGAIGVIIGILLRRYGPGPVPEVPIDPHQFAYVIVIMGACAIAGGTLARLLSRG